ncbi:MAG: hypothetical protein U9N77_02975 [Thermodesulfobacteriota bacterium]|nr:hypothetical protein [Thermodesulfobacteriota bacterium]
MSKKGLKIYSKPSVLKVMTKKKQKDIIDDLLSGKDQRISPEIKALDCLIYRRDSDLPEDEQVKEECCYEKTRENVTVKVWEAQAKIRVRVSPETKSNLSIKRIADLVMEAILKELKKERP